MGPSLNQDIVLVPGARHIGPVDAIRRVPKNARAGKQPAIAPEPQPHGGAGAEGGAPGYRLENLLAQPKLDRQLIARELIGNGSIKVAEKDDCREDGAPSQQTINFYGSNENRHRHHQNEPGDDFDR